jgi:hypothetical protein
MPQLSYKKRIHLMNPMGTFHFNYQYSDILVYEVFM